MRYFGALIAALPVLEMLALIAIVGMMIFAVPGCTNYTAASRLAAAQGAAVADEVMTVSMFGMCKASTIGAWVREFGNDPERAAAWRTICGKALTEMPTNEGEAVILEPIE